MPDGHRPNEGDPTHAQSHPRDQPRIGKVALVNVVTLSQWARTPSIA